MGTDASLLMLCTVISEAISFVYVCVSVYSLIIIFYVLSSWIPLPYTSSFNRLRRFLFDASDPYLRLFRRWMPALGGIDLSPIVALIVLNAIGYALARVLAHFG